MAPCAAEIAAAEIDGPENGWFGQEVVVATDGETAWAVAGAPFIPGWFDYGQVWLLALPTLDLEATWTSRTAFDLTGSAIAALPGEIGEPPTIAIGSPGQTHDAPHGGAVYVPPAPSAATAQLSTDEGLAIVATDAEFYRPSFGFSVAWLALGPDGVTELVANAPGQADPPTGDREGSAIYAFDRSLEGLHDESSATRSVLASEAYLGSPEGWDGDGDGLDDLVASTNGAPSAVVRFPSPWIGSIDVEDASHEWTLEADLSVSTLDDVGDLTGDGTPELAIGDSTWDGTVERVGALWIVEGGSPTSGNALELPLRWEGTFSGEAVGGAASGGDVNGDGINDLLASAYSIVPSIEPGKVAVFLGPLAVAPLTSEDADVIVYSEFAFDNFGIDLGVVDSDFDGRDDLVIGASGANASSGKVYLILGSALFP